MPAIEPFRQTSVLGRGGELGTSTRPKTGGNETVEFTAIFMPRLDRSRALHCSFLWSPPTIQANVVRFIRRFRRF